MQLRIKIPMALLCAAITCAAQAQFYKLHNADVGANITTPFSTPLTHNGPGTYDTTHSAGLLVSLRDHPVSWAGIEINGGYNTFGQQYSLTQQIGLNTVNSQYRFRTTQWEATAGYVLHVHTPWVQPFLVVGGGGVDFVPVDRGGPNQWRGAGMYEVGFDFQPKSTPHVGFRIQDHSLIYRAPAYSQAQLATSTWVHQSSPSIGFYLRW